MSRLQNSVADAASALSLPAPVGLPELRIRGRDCVWCGITLTAETAIELGTRTCDAYGTEAHRFPRSCRSCLAEQAYKALFDHAPSCEHCAADVNHCEIGVALRRLMREGRR